MTHIVKRRGHKQEFDERKVYASVFAACLNAQIDNEEAESIANLVTREIKEWLEGENEVSSDAIFEKAGEKLKRLSKEAAFMYKTHRDIS